MNVIPENTSILHRFCAYRSNFELHYVDLWVATINGQGYIHTLQPSSKPQTPYDHLFRIDVLRENFFFINQNFSNSWEEIFYFLI